MLFVGTVAFGNAWYNSAEEYDVAYSKNEALITAISWTIWGGASAYLFKENRAMALAYYKEENMETVDSLFSF